VPASLREVLHPVGRLPARVYWRRRLVVLAVLLALLGGGGWLTLHLLDGNATSAAATAPTDRPVPTPGLERVLPSLTAVRTPDGAPRSSDPGTTPAPAGPAAGSACSDEMIDLSMGAPEQIRAGSAPTLAIVVRNVSEVPCVRRLDKELQEIVLLDADGRRVWGSNDCLPEQSDTNRSLAPGEDVALPVVWSGRTSEPTCTRTRQVPAAGDYVLRGRLDTATTPDLPVRIR
jgi:hypothetical protein